MALSLTLVARIAYDADRGFAEMVDSPDPQPDWGAAETWRKNLWKRYWHTYLEKKPFVLAMDFHHWWRIELEANGWTFGAALIGPPTRQHPFIIADHNSVSDEQQRRQDITRSIFESFAIAWTQAEVDALQGEAAPI